MQEKIYTIPLNESFEQPNGCPICRLKRKLESDGLEYILGAAMMEPGVRISTNKLGFCRPHISKMLSMKNRLGLSLTLQTYTEETIDKAFVGGLLSKPDCIKAAEALRKRTETCFICKRIDEHMNHYLDNCVYLWETQEDFRRKFADCEYICMPDAVALLMHGAARLPKKKQPEFVSAVYDRVRTRIVAAKTDLDAFCKSFEYQNAGVSLTDNQKRAAECAADVLRGAETL